MPKKTLIILCVILFITFNCMAEVNYCPQKLASINYWPTAFFQIGDINNDRVQEIIYPQNSKNLSIISLFEERKLIDGQIESGSSVLAEIFDLNKNGINEIIIGQDSFPAYYGSPYIYILEYDGKTFKQTWKSSYLGDIVKIWKITEKNDTKCVIFTIHESEPKYQLYLLEFDNSYQISEPIILEGPIVYVGKKDGEENILITLSKLSDYPYNIVKYTSTDYKGFRVLNYTNLKSYRIKNREIFELDSPFSLLKEPIWYWGSSDINNNNELETIIGTFINDKPCLKIFEGDSLLFTSEALISQQKKERLGLAIGDIEGDQQKEIITTFGYKITHTENGYQVSKDFKDLFDMYPAIFQVELSDIDNDGKDEILFLAGSQDEYEFLADYQSYLYLIDIE